MMAPANAVEPPAAAAAAHGPTTFVLGVWMQPVGSMDAWKARGVNTVVEIPQGHDAVAWRTRPTTSDSIRSGGRPAIQA